MDYQEWKEAIFNIISKNKETLKDARIFRNLLLTGHRLNYCKEFDFPSFFSKMFREHNEEFTYYKQDKLKYLLVLNDDILDIYTYNHQKTYRQFKGYAFDVEGIYRGGFMNDEKIVKKVMYRIKEIPTECV